MILLGFGGLTNDPACAVAKDGELLAAIEQKKISRRFMPGELPEEAIATCLAIAGARPEDVDCVAIARPEGALHVELRTKFPNARVIVVEHHAAHAAAAYFASGFDEATILTLDRAGDFRCGARWRAQGNQLEMERELYYPDSLADLYGRVTEFLGFESNADEHKLQWLSMSGDASLSGVFENILAMKDADWPAASDRSYFDGERVSRGGFSGKFHEAVGAAEKDDIAAALQRAVETLVERMAGSGKNLCLGGGLFLNALLVAALERSGKFENVFVQPAAGNGGNALGALFYAWNVALGHSERMSLGNFCLGPSYSAEEIKQVLENCKLRFRYLLTSDEVIESAVRELKKDRIVAWMQGHMEFGPRALGNRSILASPLNSYSTENLNTFIKHRESFRKFAASVPAELAGEYFEVGPNARFLATAGKVRPAHREIFAQAVLGHDTVRVHTVSKEDNPLYWRLLHRAAQEFGIPVLFNTSFNLFGDPLVCTPRDAVRSFYSSGIDTMFVGNFVIEK
jgi:carbamoyltransferase